MDLKVNKNMEAGIKHSWLTGASGRVGEWSLRMIFTSSPVIVPTYSLLHSLLGTKP